VKFRTLILITGSLLLAAITSAHAQFSVLRNFGTKTGDPSQPINSGIVAQGRDGSLYSTTVNGGAHNSGAVFKITPAGTLNLVYASMDLTVARLIHLAD